MNASSKFPLSRARIVLLSMGFLLASVLGLKAQTTITNSAGGNGFSPSSTSFVSGGNNYVVTAYTYLATSPNCRQIAISVSTNGGNSWSAGEPPMSSTTGIPLPAPTFTPPGGSSFLSNGDVINLDDAQILTLGGDNLILVVRGWCTNTSQNECLGPNPYQDQPGTVFLKSGIFAIFSTDGGVHWGTPTSSGLSAQWQTLDAIDASAATGQPITLEYPRVAYRQGFADRGYISWVKKVFSTSPLLWSDNPITLDYEDLGYTSPVYPNYGNSDRVVTYSNPPLTKFGFASFNVTDLATTGTFGVSTGFGPLGKLIPPYANSNQYVAKYDQPNVAGSGLGDIQTLYDCPSIAISPDGLLWVGWYALALWSTVDQDGDADDENWYPWTGAANPPAYYCLAAYQTSSTDDGMSSKSLYLPGSTGISEDGVIVDQQSAPGLLGVERGYLYLQDENTSQWSEDAPGNPDFDLNVEQGPSIQVISPNASACDAQYEVGFLYAYNPLNIDGPEDLDPIDRATDHSKVQTNLGFFSAFVSPVPSNQIGCTCYFYSTTAPGPATDWLSHSSRQSSSSTALIEGTQQDDAGDSIRLFPVLKYANANDPVFGVKPTNGAAAPSSYFVMSYLSMYRGSANLTGSYLTSATAKIGISFDGVSFQITDDASTHTYANVSTVLGAESNTIGNTVNTALWGSKMDIASESGGLDIHPVWHSIRATGGTNPPEPLVTNVANTVIVKPLFTPNYPNAQPTLPVLPATTTPVLKVDRTSSYIWNTYKWFGLELSGSTMEGVPSTSSPSQIDGAPTSTPNGGIANGAVSYTFDAVYSQNPALPRNADPVPFGISYAKYNVPSPTLGYLNWSNQRKIVQTGALLHTVQDCCPETDPPQNCFYLMNPGTETATTNQLGSFADPQRFVSDRSLLPGGIHANSFYEQRNPDIGVYQQGDVSGFNGQAAIAATWFEHWPVGTTTIGTISVDVERWRILLEVREFNVCSGTYPGWSDPYVVAEWDVANGYLNTDPDRTGGLYSTLQFPTPVVAPLILPDPSGSSLTDNLVGWTVTWNMPCPILSTDGRKNFTDLDSYDDYFIGFLGSGSYPSTLFSSTWVRPPTASWGNYPTNANTSWEGTNTYSYAGVGGTGGSAAYNLLCISGQPGGPEYLYLPSVTCTENKSNPTELDQAVSFSDLNEALTNYDKGYEELWAGRYSYFTSGLVGQLDVANSLVPTNPNSLQRLPVLIAGPNSQSCISDHYGMSSITVNSQGEKFIAYEHSSDNNCSPGTPAFTMGIDVSQTNKYTQFPAGDYWFHSGNAASVRWSEPYNGWSPAHWTPEGYPFWMRNPSISSSPKTPEPAPSKDKGAVELSIYNQCVLLGATMTEVDQLYTETSPNGLSWPPSGPLTGLPSTGKWSERSFGTFSPGPSPADLAGILNPGSYVLANDLNSPVGIFASQYGNYASFKGTFDTVLPYNLYRDEEETNGCGTSTFVWGNVTLTTGSPTDATTTRQVELHSGITDSAVLTTANQYRDSLFSTKVFDIQPGEQINYYRAILIPPCAGEGSGCTEPLAIDSAFQMNYTVQLVNAATGAIDTVETVVDKPAFGEVPAPMNIHLTVDTILEDVYLRVVGNVTGVSDSNYHFTDERMFGTYPSDSDGYLAMKKTLALALPSQSGLSVVAPYPNPVQNPTFDAGFLLSGRRGRSRWN